MNENLTELKELIEIFGKEDEKLKSETKLVDQYKSNIKDMMASLHLTEESSDNFKASYTIQTRTTLDEDKMLLILQNDWLLNHKPEEVCPYIKTKEYIDMDALENALFNNQFSTETVNKLDTCKTDKKVQVLKVARKKR